MKTGNIPQFAYEDHLTFLVELIADDLKIHRHLHLLSLSGLDGALLKTNIHDKVFALAGIAKSKIDDSLREWYFQKAEKVFEIDIFKDEEQLYKIATEILVELNRRQYAKPS